MNEPEAKASAMKPIIILPPDIMSKEDIELLRGNGLCVVEATNPAAVRFVDPISSAMDRPKIEQAAIELSRRLLNNKFNTADMKVGKWEISRLFVECLIGGTPLQEGKTQAEIDAEEFQDAKWEEIRRLAREEAKAEREEAKTAIADKKKGKSS